MYTIFAIESSTNKPLCVIPDCVVVHIILLFIASEMLGILILDRGLQKRCKGDITPQLRGDITPQLRGDIN